MTHATWVLDGAVLFAREGDLPEASIWVAVDVATGAYGAYAPAEFGVSETPLSLARAGSRCC